MLGYSDLKDPSVSSFFRFLAKVGDNGMKMQIVKIGFGGKKIPELMRGLGRGVKEFKDAVNKDYTAEDNKPGDKSDSGKTE